MLARAGISTLKNRSLKEIYFWTNDAHIKQSVKLLKNTSQSASDATYQAVLILNCCMSRGGRLSGSVEAGGSEPQVNSIGVEI